MNKMFTVIKFTFMSNFSMKSFKVMTLILALIVTLVINLPIIIDSFSGSEEQKADKIGVFANNAEIAAKLTDYYQVQEKPRISIVNLPDAGSKEANDSYGKEQIKAGEIEGYLEISDELVAGFPKAVYKSEASSMETGIKSELGVALQAIKTNMVLKDISQEQLMVLQTPVTIDSVQVKTSDTSGTSGRSEEEMTVAFGLVYALLFLIYMSVISYGSSIATSITQEKSSRVMELLITSSAPVHQMFGKIFGVCLLGIVQIAVLVIVAFGNLMLPFNQDMIAEMNLDLSSIPFELLIYFIIFYLGGFFIYAMVAAGIGSIVSRIEDVGQAIMPMMFLIMAGFFIAIFGLQSPDAPFIVAMSYVPFFAPLIMFLRIGLSNPAWWEIALSIGILIASIALLGWLAAKIYRTGVLLYGKRPSIKELRKAMKSM